MHCLYQITNLLNNKYYIGVHKTPMGNYMGSGKGIKAAIKKYGKENFKRDILVEHEDEKFIYQLESAVVNEEFVKRQDNYNACIGGNIPPNWKDLKRPTETRQRMSEAQKGNKKGLGNKGWSGKTRSLETKQKISIGLTGRPCSEETRNKIRLKRIG